MPPSLYSRRKTLQLATLGLTTVSGCISAGTSPSRSTESSTVSETSSTESPTRASTVIEGVVVPPCPTKPNEFTRETVLGYASQFEKSYFSRITLREQTADVRSIDVRIEEGQAERADNGWLVYLSVLAPYIRFRVSPEYDEPDHVDPGFFTASYFISEQTVLRARGGEPADPRDGGNAVYCPPAG